ncbi:DoxX family protein [Streptomyces sp. NPDC002889]|uniref:DoxX family protein n=1 Tax=Streptomyces sp. NPDC002889 TaxID=3364669 RepID=UPI0036B62DA7
MAAPSLPSRLNQAQPYAIGLFRIVVGLLFTCQGAASLFGVLGRDSVPTGTWPFWYAAAIEVVAGVLVFAGIGTRSAAFIASGAMAFAYFTEHQPKSLFPLQNGGELSVMFCWAFLLLVFTGPGALALDKLFAPRGERSGARQEGNDQAAAATA